MLKIEYKAEPFYTECGLNEPCTKELSVVFDDDATATEIIGQFIEILKYAGYRYIANEDTLNAIIDDLVADGIVKENENM